jgi:hypothetical protein
VGDGNVGDVVNVVKVWGCCGFLQCWGCWGCCGFPQCWECWGCWKCCEGWDVGDVGDMNVGGLGCWPKPEILNPKPSNPNPKPETLIEDDPPLRFEVLHRGICSAVDSRATP